MSRRSPHRIELTPEERAALERRTRRQTATRREVFRGRIVILAADGLRNDEIAERLGTVRTTVSRWRKRYLPKSSMTRLLGGVPGTTLAELLKEGMAI